MVQRGSRVVVADNSGAMTALVFGILGGTRNNRADVGDIVVVAIKSATPNGKVKKGDVKKALIVRTVAPIRMDNTYTKFNDNAIVILDDKSQLLGTFINGKISRKCVEKNPTIKLSSFASEGVV